MDLLLTSTFAGPPKASPTWDGRQRAFSSTARPTDSGDSGQGAFSSNLRSAGSGDEQQGASSSNVRPTDSGDGGQGASASFATLADFTSTVERTPIDPLLGAGVLGNALPVETVPHGEPLLPILGPAEAAPHCLETAVEGASREIVSLPGRQTAAGNSWPGLLGAETAPGWAEQASLEVEVGSPQGEGGSSARHRIVPESNSLGSDNVQDETAEGAFLSKEGGPSKGETQAEGPRAMLARMEALKGMEQAGEQQGGDLKSAGHTGPGENAGSLAGKDGASWNQEVQMDLPARPAPPPLTSTHAGPTHAAQAGSGGMFRVLGDAVHMRIQDEELGPMRWHIHLRGGRITAEAIVETTRVQQLLHNHQELLEAKLNAMGVEIEEFDVSVGEGSQRFAAFSDPDGPSRARRSTEDRPSDPGLEPIVSKLHRNQDRELDLYV